MLEGLHAAAAGMTAQQHRLDALADDLANVSTTGYKRRRVAFRDLVYGAGAQGALPGVALGAGSAAATVGRSSAQGALRTTERPLDVAVEGPGFLQVRLGDGTLALTRDGALRVDERRRLVTADGALLQPPIVLPAGVDADELSIAADGTVRAGAATLGRLALVDVTSTAGLQAGPGNLFTPTEASGPVRPAAGARLVQGALEASNVDMADAMVEMMEAQRSFQLASKAVQMQDEMLGVANGVKR